MLIIILLLVLSGLIIYGIIKQDREDYIQKLFELNHTKNDNNSNEKYYKKILQIEREKNLKTSSIKGWIIFIVILIIIFNFDKILKYILIFKTLHG